MIATIDPGATGADGSRLAALTIPAPVSTGVAPAACTAPDSSMLPLSRRWIFFTRPLEQRRTSGGTSASVSCAVVFQNRALLENPYRGSVSKPTPFGTLVFIKGGF